MHSTVMTVNCRGVSDDEVTRSLLAWREADIFDYRRNVCVSDEGWPRVLCSSAAMVSVRLSRRASSSHMCRIFNRKMIVDFSLILFCGNCTVKDLDSAIDFNNQSPRLRGLFGGRFKMMLMFHWACFK